MISILLVLTLLGAVRYGNTETLNYLGCYLKEDLQNPAQNPALQNPALQNPAPGNKSGNFAFEAEPRNGKSAFGSTTGLDIWYTPLSSSSVENPHACATACHRSSFRYAGIYSANGSLRCGCGSSYGRFGIGQCLPCSIIAIGDEHEYCGSLTSTSIYDTGFKVPSQPQKVTVLHRSENTLKISWIQPFATNGPLTGYKISSVGLFSYSQIPEVLNHRTWRASEVDQELLLTGLAVGTEYRISVTAINSEGESVASTITAWTKIGVPDTPAPPMVIQKDSSTMTIKFSKMTNTKGPLSKYRVAMIDESRLGFFSKDRGTSWNESMGISYPFYIAAEFLPDNAPWNGKFVIGDRRTYSGFYNGPIPEEGHWHPSIGIMSTVDGQTEISYSATSHEQHRSFDFHQRPKIQDEKSIRRTQSKDREIDYPEAVVVHENSVLVTALWVSIGIAGIILVLCVSIFFVLRLELLPKRRRRQSLDQSFSRSAAQLERPTELTNCRNPPHLFPDEFSGGYIHSGFVHDEDLKGRALDRLKNVWYVPRNFIAIPSEDEESVKLIGKGRYGPVHLSQLKSSSENRVPVSLYTIPGVLFKPEEGNRSREDSEIFFRELDELVKLDPHENVLKLLGFIEDKDSLLFVVESFEIPLKQWLLEFRASPNKDKFSSTASLSYSFLICAMNIAEAMFHLASFKITHGELAASNVLVKNIESPKVTGFGVLKMDSLKLEKDYTRWFAVEQFQNLCIKRCDIWSFAILLWELSTLGGTPYHDIRTEDLRKRICQGSRPQQLEIIGDSLYQIMLHCWQLDRDERPDFGALSCSIHELLPRSEENLFISSSFSYPPYIHSYEHTKS